MTLARPICSNQTTHCAPIRALRSLRLQDAEIIAQIVGSMADEWIAQTFDDYDGYLSILVEPTSQEAAVRPTYLVCGKTGHVELAAVDGDEYKTIGSFNDIYAVAAELTSRMLESAVRAA